MERLLEEIKGICADAAPDRIFVITDSNVARIADALIAGIGAEETMVIPAGEEHKTLGEVERVTSVLGERGATRRSLLICIGGGMVTDLGGFAAAIFKRGIRHINVATTLLGAVDASVGGKTGVDFRGLKNELGAFHMPLGVLACVDLFGSLPPVELLSGFGEVVKTALLSDAGMTGRVLASDPAEVSGEFLDEVCRFCRDVKERIVSADPTEKGLRKVLNLGHTAGHAFESLMIGRGTPVAHGVAVAHGLLVTLILSNILRGLPATEVSRYAGWLRRNYPALPFTCTDYDAIWEIARHDKKNSGDEATLSFVLLEKLGCPSIDVPVDRRAFEAALDLYQEFQGR
ncbi:MAG: 3-dehydroquinate synthase [Muribaculaceae bacterium]|nr:3-dehydroquinate synthase [Muribaculaceae bacterium]